jgi:hypothetical protein
MTKASIILLILVLLQPAYGQVLEPIKLDKELTEEYMALVNREIGAGDSVFGNHLDNVLRNIETFNFPFDSLATKIKFLTSDDK